MSRFGTHTGEFEALSEVDQILHLERVHKQLPYPVDGWGTFDHRVRGHDFLHSPQGAAAAKVADAITAEFEHRLFHVLEDVFDAGALWGDYDRASDEGLRSVKMSEGWAPPKDRVAWIDANFSQVSAILRGLGYPS